MWAALDVASAPAIQLVAYVHVIQTVGCSHWLGLMLAVAGAPPPPNAGHIRDMNQGVNETKGFEQGWTGLWR